MKYFKLLLVISIVLSLNILNCSGEKKQTDSMDKTIIKLPEPILKSNVSIEEALLQRRSVREYADEPLTMQELSQLLWSAYGITQHAFNGPDFLRGGFRTTPSAGALYPLEFHVIAGNVDGLEPGIYHYNSEKHVLSKVIDSDKRKDISEAALQQEMFETAPVTIVIAAEVARTASKYGARGREHYVWLEAGHSAQNICLQCVSLNLGTCTVGAFDDAKIIRILNLKGEEEPVYLLPVGRKK
ncbi:MAG: SagB/ThcOx family dehydrogenase [Bacteroidetes bacterium]|nr:SagB/ThcOx family dehydrogenase [Bacteroidota bacterium]